MAEKASNASPELSAGDPGPLEFQLITQDDHTTVYEALVVDCKTPGSPVLAISVTVASSIQRNAGKQLDSLLGKMKASFAVEPGPPPPSGDEPGGEAPFDPRTAVSIGVRLASYGSAEPVNVAVNVDTTAGAVPASAGADPSGESTVIRDWQVGTGLSDYWHADGNTSSFTAKVTPSSGYGTLESPGKHSVPLAPHILSRMTGEVVIVQATDRTPVDYRMEGSFHRSRHNVS